MPLPLLAALGVLGAGGLISRRSDMTGNEPGMVGGLLQDVFRSSGFASAGNRRREQGLMDERLMAQQARAEFDARQQREQAAQQSGVANSPGLMGLTQSQQTPIIEQYERMSEGTRGLGLQTPAEGQKQMLATVAPLRTEYLKRVTPLQEQAAKNTAIVDMLNQGGGVAGYGATKIWLQSLDNAMVTNAEMAGAMAGTGIQERVGQILSQAEDRKSVG